MKRLTSWREVINPRSDVVQGELTLSEFAADLGDAAAGRGSSEYTDPSEFFGMTYLTEGLKRLLSNAVRRVSGKGGDPVIQIKTAFGGGKTHSMLALYHMLKRGWAIGSVLDMAGVPIVPKVNVSVLAFNHQNPLRPGYVGGTRTNTLCGLMAAQLGGYEYVRENDEKGVSPGKDDLIRMFDELGPCVVLMDELVAYGRKIYGAEGLPEEGTYGNFLTFLQELTEAAGMSRNSLVVATLPESETEAGEGGGVTVLHEVEHIFGRIESVWKPVTADEGFEIVKKRLFRECVNENARRETADEFSRMYRANPNDFPLQAREGSYRDRLEKCYPIHPEVFDRLYEDWSTLEMFQRTRGVLRLMARVVRELWAKNDDGALIMPGSLPLSRSDVMEELTRPLPSHYVWNGIIEGDIDGEKSASFQEDMRNDRFSPLCACRRNARTIMLGSAPSQGKEAVRGIERPRVLLGSVRPGDNIAAFNEALNTMKETLSYLYTDSSGARYWFDTMPNLQKTVRSRADQIESYRVNEEIRRRLTRQCRNDGKMFAGVHVWPDSSQSIPDDTDGVRLVVLEAEASDDKRLDILLRHGNNKRAHLNTIVFLCADSGEVLNLRRKVRTYLAWRDIQADSEKLNLGTRQLNEVKENILRAEAEADSGVRSAWRKVSVPYSEYGGRTDAITFENASLSGNEEIIPSLVSCLAGRDWVVFPEKGFAPSQLLNMMNSYDLWRTRNELSVRDLWNDLCSYCYLYRVSKPEVLFSAIAKGVSEGKFALAEGVSEGKYAGLKHGVPVVVRESAYVVKIESALEQERAESGEQAKPEPEKPVTMKVTPTLTVNEPPTTTQSLGATHFHMHTNLEAASFVRDIKKIYDEVIRNLQGEGNFTIQLNVDFEAWGEIERELQRAIEDNCKAMKIECAEFE